MNEFQPPSAEDASGGARPVVWLALCLTLGIVGVLMTCWSGSSVAWGQLAPNLGTLPPEQAAVNAEILAQQGWWAVPLVTLQLLLKMALSVGLVVGAGLALSRRPAGARLLRPVLVFGVVFELGAALYGAIYTFLQRGQMAEQFSRGMAANPTISPELAEQAGALFGIGMLIMMVFMLGWAVVKSAVYLATRRAIS